MYPTNTTSPTAWPDYRAVWRWHFYASLFCMPLVIVLSITGAIYLFKPQYDRWQDRQYDNLTLNGIRAPISAQIRAALQPYPGAIPLAFELPQTNTDASRVILYHQGAATRVFVHPTTLDILGTRPDTGGLMQQVKKLHGQLGLGERGSLVVELAASWTMVMVLTGLFLWWPRSAKGWGGILYPRLRKGSKLFWRDIHSVTGIWISLCVIFLLATGLPWAKFWGNYLRSVRAMTGLMVAEPSWTMGGAIQSESQTQHHGQAERRQTTPDAGGAKRKSPSLPPMPEDLTCFDRVAATVTPLRLAHPASISPPLKGSQLWVAKSETQNRPLRVTMKVNGETGEILSREDFASRHWLDQVVAIGIAAHEGQLFGLANQLLGLLTALGLIMLSLSGYVMWWRRRKPGTLGAPRILSRPRASTGLIGLLAMLAIYLPLFGLSLVVVLIVERLALARLPIIREWLGLNTTNTTEGGSSVGNSVR